MPIPRAQQRSDLGFCDRKPDNSGLTQQSPSRDSTCLSLFDAWRSSFTISAAIQNKEDWHVGWYAEGNTWVQPDDRLDSIEISFNLLSDWGRDYQATRSEYNPTDRTITLPAPQRLAIEVNGIQAIFHFGWSATSSISKYQAKIDSAIEIHDHMPLNEIGHKWVFPLQTLLEFLTLRSIDIKKLTARSAELNGEVQVHYNIAKSVQDDNSSDETVHAIQMLSSLSNFENRGVSIETLLHKYFALIEDPNHKIGFWFLNESEQRLPDLTADTEFLNVFRALERYHTTAIGGESVTDEVHKDRVKTIVDSSPQEHLEWLRNLLTAANNKGLRRQVNEVLERSEGTALKIKEAWPGFFDSIVSLRSKVAHGVPDMTGEVGLRCHAAATGLRWILRHVYLIELGLSDSDAAETIASCMRFEQDLRMLQDWYRQLERA